MSGTAVRSGAKTQKPEHARPEPVGGGETPPRHDGSATTMANIDIVAGGAGLNGTWARDALERAITPGGRSKAAKDMRPRVEPHERCRASASVWQLGQAAKMPGGGSVTAHAHNVLEKNPCTNDPRGDAKDVPA